MVRRRKILVPEAREGLDRLKAAVVHAPTVEQAKLEAAEEAGIPLKEGYNGEMTARDAGKVGGRLGGSMVRELVKMAQESIKKK